MAQGKKPERSREAEDNRRSDYQLEHQLHWLTKRFDKKPRRNVCHDHYWNDPAKNEAKEPWENYVRVARDVEKIEVAVNKSLRPHDPETHRRQAEHDRVMNRDPESDSGQIKQDRHWTGNDAKARQGNADDGCSDNGVDHAIETELFGGSGELAVDRQDEHGIEFSSADELGNVGHVHEKERLKELGDDLVGADQQHHFPFRPIADAIDLSENDAEENDLPDKPKHFHQHPENEIGLETQLANERVAQHDGVDVDVTAHHVLLSFNYGLSQPSPS